jgi:hypothetical protein
MRALRALEGMERGADVTEGERAQLIRERAWIAPPAAVALPQADACDEHHGPQHRPRGQKGAGMTDENSWETEDEQPEVEGHRQAAAPESVRDWSEDTQERAESEVEGHVFQSPEKAAEKNPF